MAYVEQQNITYLDQLFEEREVSSVETGAGAGGGSQKRTVFVERLRAGAAVEGRANRSGGGRAGSGRQRTGHPRARGTATETGSEEKTGLSLSRETTSVLEHD